jgi:phosphopantetheine adenylyltransferase
MSKSLLLLPPPPTNPSPEVLRAAYHPSITSALIRLSSLNLQNSTILEVALSCPGLLSRLSRPMSELFADTQHLLAGLYTLVCDICEQNSIEQDGPQGLDVRILLTTYDESEHPSNDWKAPLQSTYTGPVVDFQTFAFARRLWNFVFYVDGEQGVAIFNRYRKLSNLISPSIRGEICRVQGGISLQSTTTATITPQLQSPSRPASCHSIVAVGGTFDHLHAGHKLLLTATALVLQPPVSPSNTERRLIVGITGDELLKNKKYAEYLMSWEQRQQSVVDFLTSILLFTRPGKEEIKTISFDEAATNGRAIHTELKRAAVTIECVEIQDPFGPTVTDEVISALVVSRETSSGGAAVNAKREGKGWKPLEVFEVDVLGSDDNKSSSTATEQFAAKISSTAIRKRILENPPASTL